MFDSSVEVQKKFHLYIQFFKQRNIYIQLAKNPMQIQLQGDVMKKTNDRYLHVPIIDVSN